MNEVLTTNDSGILRITINRPEQRNALNLHVLAGIRRAIRESRSDRAVRAITLTGSGDKAFCAGADLKSTLGPSEGAFNLSDYRETLVDILQCPKPTVALAKGHVLAGGLGLLLSCDLALACDDIQFSTPEIQVGMFPMMVLSLLYRHVGRKRATEMLFFGEHIAAAAAMKYGIVNLTCPREQFDHKADEYLRKLAGKSAAILRLGKEAVFQLQGKSLPGELAYLESELAKVMSTADSREGIRAFAEKRDPRWRDE